MLVKKVLETIKNRGLLMRRDKILVALSGGPDSTALLHILYKEASVLGITLHAAHLNHMIRGRAALADQKFVEGVCRKHSIPLTVKSVNVPAFAKKQKISLEDAGRRARYDFFEEVAGRVGADKIALGHTADDNVETVLMRLVTGTGMRGLLGIPAFRGKIIRPLIDSWRSEIESYCREHGLKPRTDLSNYDTRYLRNRIRHKLIPVLTGFNPNVKESIRQMADILSSDYKYLIDISTKALHGAVMREEKGSMSLDIDKLLMYPDSIRRLALRLAIEGVKGDLENVTYSHVEDILSHLPLDKKWELHLPGNLYVSGDGDRLRVLSERPEEGGKVAFEYKFKIPGVLHVEEAGLRITAEVVDDVSGLKLKLKDKDRAVVDLAKVGRELLVRSRRAGDKFSPFGSSAAKKLADFFIDEKVPHDRRDMIPIIESRGRIVWVAGHRIDDAFKITSRTKGAVRMVLTAV